MTVIISAAAAGSVSGVTLVIAALYFFVRPLSDSKAGWWLGVVFAVLGLAVAVYNSTQAEFPLPVKIVYFLPPLAGVFWLALPGAGKEQSVTSPVTGTRA